MLTVILPVYNRKSKLIVSVDSIANQYSDQWKLIIVDDCSTDGSYALAKSYEKPGKINVLQTPHNAGAAYARNLGVQHADTPFISFLDSDDAFEPGFVEHSLSFFSRQPEEVGMIWTGVRYHKSSDGKRKSEECIWKPQQLDSPYNAFLSDLKIGTNSGITVRKSVFDKVGLFDDRLPAAEDTDFFLRLSQSFRVDFIDKVLINIHQEGDDRLSKDFSKIAQAYNLIIPKHEKAIAESKALQLKFGYKLCWLNFHLGDQGRARGYFKKVISINLLHVKTWLVFILFELLGQRIGRLLHTRLSRLGK